MPPRQGESKFVGPAADVWALGVMLYECLCGQRPITGNGDFDVIRKVIDEEPKSLRSVSREVPKVLEFIVLKCLTKTVADRYNTTQLLADDLQSWLEAKPRMATIAIANGHRDVISTWPAAFHQHCFAAAFRLRRRRLREPENAAAQTKLAEREVKLRLRVLARRRAYAVTTASRLASSPCTC